MRWQDIKDDREKYAAYLCSREWSVLKMAVHRRAAGLCERCKFSPVDAVHHLTYARKYKEEIEDLQGLCNNCHAFIHGKTDRDPAQLPAAKIVSEGSRIVIEVGPWKYDLTSSVGLSILNGFVSEKELRMHIDLAVSVSECMKSESADREVRGDNGAQADYQLKIRKRVPITIEWVKERRRGR